MESSKNGRWIIPFKNFSKLSFKIDFDYILKYLKVLATQMTLDNSITIHMVIFQRPDILVL